MNVLIPVFDDIHASLTEDQQARLNAWISKRHGDRS
jgi:hypothetical protein